jgi:type IV pilus assembly protein PilE
LFYASGLPDQFAHAVKPPAKTIRRAKLSFFPRLAYFPFLKKEIRMHSLPRNKAGFTLIEVMIVVAIIGALAAIAIPNYQEYVVKARVNEAVAGLSDMRVKMEQYFQDNRQYPGACAANTVAPLPTNTKYFDFSCTFDATNGAIYTVTATGRDAAAGFVYTLDQANTRKTTAVPAGSGWSTSNNCWRTSKGGC